MNTPSQDSILKKKILTRSSSEKETQKIKNSSQGQDIQTSGNGHLKTYFSKALLKNNYEKEIFSEASSNEAKSFCKTCQKEIYFQYRKSHLLSLTYWKNTPKIDHPKMLDN